MSSKSIIVTGASRGIGYAILEKFAAQGYRIGFCSSNEDKVTKAKEKLQQQFPHIHILAEVCDMSQKNEVIAFGNKCLAEFNAIDILVNNAGQYLPDILTEDMIASNHLETMMNTNLYSAYWLGKIIIPTMKEYESGHIFNISSIAGLDAYPNSGSYTVTKFALTGYTRMIREELKSYQIKVTGVYPGATYTDSWSGSDLPRSRFVLASDIAEMIYTCAQLSPSAVVEDILIRPQLGDI